ncbi:MAG: 23S rRNA (pseudouridine(1915)-N(3))-methyltransferase RlmH [Sphingobacteriales bacterium]|nr:23S rRNA (pseudouridine(1915)-N(3))-methyltransferase RlmH [Sphingobacteriales bacterium]
MKIVLLLNGKTSAAYLSEGIEMYRQRLQRYGSFEIQVLPDIKNAKTLSVEELKRREDAQTLAALESTDWVVLLDERGAAYSSEQFAAQIQKLQLQRIKRLFFVVGGAYGFGEAMYQRANGKISLSAMTFSHQLIRLLFMEQLYRAFTILNNEPYHHA